jgi:DNA-binding response OmpR family regulator
MIETISLRILIVEDDQRMLDLLCKGLSEVGHVAIPASDGETGLALAMQSEFDAIILDIGLPCRDGYNVTHALRSDKRMVPILMLTARDAEDDVIRAFDFGADDYMIKPFSFREMLVRLQGLVRLSRRKNRSSFLALDPIRLTVLRGNTIIHLTRTEFLLLASLNDHAGEPATRQSLIEAVWGRQHPVNPNTLDVLVNAVRGKFDVPYKTKLIATVRGVGYRLETCLAGETGSASVSNRELPS